MLKEITTIKEIEQLIQSNNRFAIYKHSTRCNISYDALQEVRSYLENSSSDIYIIDVIRQRDISNYIESISGIRHESPQLIIYENANAVFNTSHFRITQNLLTEELS